jgi:RIO kinase 1
MVKVVRYVGPTRLRKPVRRTVSDCIRRCVLPTRNLPAKRKKEWLDEAEAFEGAVRGRPQDERSRRQRRRPNAKRTVRDLLAKPTEGATGEQAVFAEPGMEHLRQRGYFDTLLGLVKGGKEATVYLVARGDERFAAKIYADHESRAFRNDRAYWAGVHIDDKRVERALRQRTRRGQAAAQGMWVMREYANLWRLSRAGLPVPKPLVGPDVSDMLEAGAVVLMQFIGHGDTPAPRLADVRLTEEQAADAYQQSADLLLRLAGMGLVHGDFSTYNLLWHDGQVVLIVVPQMLNAKSAGQAARALLERDVASLISSFRRHRTPTDEVGLKLRALQALS